MRLLSHYVVGQAGGLVSSTVVPEVQINIPTGALTKEMNIGVEVTVSTLLLFKILILNYSASNFTFRCK